MFEGKPAPKPTQENTKLSGEIYLDNLFSDNIEAVPRSETDAVSDPEVAAFIAGLQFTGNEAIPLVQEEVEAAEELEIELTSKQVLGEEIGVADIVEIGKTLAALEKLKIAKAAELSAEVLQNIKNIEVRLRSVRDQETETT